MLGWVAERHPALVTRIVAAGHEVASHGYGHRLVYDQTPDRVPGRRAARQGAARAGHWRGGQRLPRAQLLDRAAIAVGARRPDRGRLHATTPASSPSGTTATAFRSRHGTPTSSIGVNGRLIEAPASTAEVGGTNLPIAGGGYFRLLPYGWTRWGIRRVNETEGRPVIFYLHPWEIDPDQPRLPGRTAQPRAALPEPRPDRGASSAAVEGLHVGVTCGPSSRLSAPTPCRTAPRLRSPTSGDRRRRKRRLCVEQLHASGHPDATAYHRWAWRDVFSSAFGHDSIYLVAHDGDPRSSARFPWWSFEATCSGPSRCRCPS